MTMRSLGLHYHSEADVVALRCRQCHKYYACYKCHDESENHDFKPADASDPVPVLFGNCMNQLTKNQYEQGFCFCCRHRFNPGCRLHQDIYFEWQHV